MNLDMALATSCLSAKHLKEIFLLAQEGQRLAMNAGNDNCQEALFCIGAQSTGYEKIASGCLDHLTAYYPIMHSEDEKVEDLDKAVKYLCKKAGEAWLETNSALF